MKNLLPISILSLQGSVPGTNQGKQCYIAYETLPGGTIGRKYGFFRIFLVRTDSKSVLEVKGEVVLSSYMLIKVVAFWG
jgi:hypothetical protein